MAYFCACAPATTFRRGADPAIIVREGMACCTVLGERARVTFQRRLRPSCGAGLGTSAVPTTPDEVNQAADELKPPDRAMLRSRLTARYDVRGHLERAAVREERRLP